MKDMTTCPNKIWQPVPIYIHIVTVVTMYGSVFVMNLLYTKPIASLY